MEDIPFQAGQLAEARSFAAGYRGAWFRCKIREITEKKGTLGHISEYYDYPDEKVKWTKLYHIPPCRGNAKDKRSELVLRPHYPPIYLEKEMPHVSEISEVTVIARDSWKVGDLVDWRNTDCYWSGRITQLYNDQEAEVELPSPPVGQGSSYRTLFKDLRPSLNWSPEHGWTIPIQEGGGGSGDPCARLIKPINKGQETEAAEVPVGSSARSNSGVLSQVKSKTTIKMQKCCQEKKDDSSTRKVDGDSGEAVELNWKKSSRVVTLNSERSDTLEAAILDLEEYLNKVKWLKNILKDGILSSSKWNVVEPHADVASETPN